MKANTLVLHGSKWNIFGKIKLRVKQKTFGTVLLDNVEGKQSADLSIVKIIVAALHEFGYSLPPYSNLKFQEAALLFLTRTVA